MYPIEKTRAAHHRVKLLTLITLGEEIPSEIGSGDKAPVNERGDQLSWAS